jgi:hypothetical protein
MMPMTGRVRAGMIVPLAVCGLIAPAVPALAVGSNMPWEQPLQQIPQSIEGPVTKGHRGHRHPRFGRQLLRRLDRAPLREPKSHIDSAMDSHPDRRFRYPHDAERLHRAWCTPRKRRGPARAYPAMWCAGPARGRGTRPAARGLRPQDKKIKRISAKSGKVVKFGHSLSAAYPRRFTMFRRIVEPNTGVAGAGRLAPVRSK